MDITIKPVENIEGRTRMPGDKSISHRALIFSSLTENTVEIEGLLQAADTLSTLSCLKEMGTYFEENGEIIKVKGKGLHGFLEPKNILDAGNSGTTARLLAGLLAGQAFPSILTGDDSLRKRPMKRITGPLKQMGAFISGRQNSDLLPLSIKGGNLLPITYTLPVASAQVKSALLIAALYAEGTTEIIDNYHTRDHTERALQYLGANIKITGKNNIVLRSPAKLQTERWQIPGDISAAAFFIVAAALSPRGELYIEGVGINPSRIGIIDILKDMGADISIHNRKEYCGEPVADLLIKSGRPLRGVEIKGKLIPKLVDEIPVLAVAGLFAEGETIIQGAQELRLKESDRLKSISLELTKMGANITELPDGLIIRGGTKLTGADLHTHGDHRIAMALSTAALFAENESVIREVESVRISFPDFFTVLSGLTR